MQGSNGRKIGQVMKNNGVKRIFGTCVLSLMLSPSYALKIEVGAGEFAPYTSEKLPNGGVLTEVMAAAFAVNDHQVNVAYLPWNRAYSETEQGYLDVTLPWSMNPERLERFYFSEPLFTFKRKIFISHESTLKVTQLEDLIGLRVCRADGYSIQGIKDLIIKNLIHHVAPPTMDICFKMMANDRVDLVVLDELEGWSAVDRVFEARDQVTMLDFTVYEYTNHLMVSKAIDNAQRILSEFNLGLKALKESGEYDTLIQLRLGGHQSE